MPMSVEEFRRSLHVLDRHQLAIKAETQYARVCALCDERDVLLVALGKARTVLADLCEWLDKPHVTGGCWLDHVDDAFMKAWGDADGRLIEEIDEALRGKP